MVKNLLKILAWTLGVKVIFGITFLQSLIIGLGLWFVFKYVVKFILWILRKIAGNADGENNNNDLSKIQKDKSSNGYMYPFFYFGGHGHDMDIRGHGGHHHH